MTVDAVAPHVPPEAESPQPATGPPPPRAGDALPTRRALLGLLASAGAAAAAVPLVGPRLGLGAADASRLDPSSALHLSVTSLTTGADSAAAPAHDGHASQPDTDASGTDALGDRVWSRLVTVGLVVHNSAAADVLFSPGQVRLRLADGTGVMPVESERPAGPLPGRTTLRTWVRFLAPEGDSPVSVDYTAAGGTDTVPLAVGGSGHEHEAQG